MKVNETHPREKGFVLWGHCQNILDDPRKRYKQLKWNIVLIQKVELLKMTSKMAVS